MVAANPLLTVCFVLLCPQPNMLVLPPQLLLYMAVAPEEKIKYAGRA